VCGRRPEERRKVQLHFTVFDKLVTQSQVDDEAERANVAWAQACIKIEVVGVAFDSAAIRIRAFQVLTRTLVFTALH
jgi:hypothetical protein